MNKAFKKWLAKLENPDNIGSSEYRVLYELLHECDLEQTDDPFGMASGILSEVIFQAQAIRNSLPKGGKKK